MYNYDIFLLKQVYSCGAAFVKFSPPSVKYASKSRGSKSNTCLLIPDCFVIDLKRDFIEQSLLVIIIFCSNGLIIAGFFYLSDFFLDSVL